jgi:hypothetical protein
MNMLSFKMANSSFWQRALFAAILAISFLECKKDTKAQDIAQKTQEVKKEETAKPDPNLHIYLAFGQSNMDGAGTIESQDRTGVDARFKVMSAVNCTDDRTRQIGKWTTANPPLVRCGDGLGILDYFGRTMVQGLPSGIKIGIVPVAVSGCDIDLYDKVNY